MAINGLYYSFIYDVDNVSQQLDDEVVNYQTNCYSNLLSKTCNRDKQENGVVFIYCKLYGVSICFNILIDTKYKRWKQVNY